MVFRAKCATHACLAEVLFIVLRKACMVAEQVPGPPRLPGTHPTRSLALDTMASGPHLRGAAQPPEDAGFGSTMEKIVKAIVVKAAMGVAVPAIAERAARMFPSHAKPASHAGTSLEIVETPAIDVGDYPFHRLVKSKQQNSTNDDHNEPIVNDQIADDDTTTTTNTTQVSRIDKEVKLVVDKELGKLIDMLDKVIDKTIFTVVEEQRDEAMEHDEKMDGLWHIMTNREQMIHEHLGLLMTYVIMSKIDDACEQIRPNTTKDKNATTTKFEMKDVDDGQPMAWAEAVAKGDRINTRQEAVEPIPINTPDNDAAAEVENLIKKRPREIINGIIVNHFHVKVLEHVEIEACPIDAKIIENSVQCY